MVVMLHIWGCGQSRNTSAGTTHAQEQATLPRFDLKHLSCYQTSSLRERDGCTSNTGPSAHLPWWDVKLSRCSMQQRRCLGWRWSVHLEVCHLSHMQYCYLAIQLVILWYCTVFYFNLGCFQKFDCDRQYGSEYRCGRPNPLF